MDLVPCKSSFKTSGDSAKDANNNEKTKPVITPCSALISVGKSA
jgi:hypothetical protein